MQGLYDKLNDPKEIARKVSHGEFTFVFKPDHPSVLQANESNPLSGWNATDNLCSLLSGDTLVTRSTVNVGEEEVDPFTASGRDAVLRASEKSLDDLVYEPAVGDATDYANVAKVVLTSMARIQKELNNLASTVPSRTKAERRVFRQIQNTYALTENKASEKFSAAQGMLAALGRKMDASHDTKLLQSVLESEITLARTAFEHGCLQVAQKAGSPGLNAEAREQQLRKTLVSARDEHDSLTGQLSRLEPTNGMKSIRTLTALEAQIHESSRETQQRKREHETWKRNQKNERKRAEKERRLRAEAEEREQVLAAEREAVEAEEIDRLTQMSDRLTELGVSERVDAACLSELNRLVEAVIRLETSDRATKAQRPAILENLPSTADTTRLSGGPAGPRSPMHGINDKISSPNHDHTAHGLDDSAITKSDQSSISGPHSFAFSEVSGPASTPEETLSEPSVLSTLGDMPDFSLAALDLEQAQVRRFHAILESQEGVRAAWLTHWDPERHLWPDMRAEDESDDESRFH